MTNWIEIEIVWQTQYSALLLELHLYFRRIRRTNGIGAVDGAWDNDENILGLCNIPVSLWDEFHQQHKGTNVNVFSEDLFTHQ